MKENNNASPPKTPITLWKFIGLMIFFAFVSVALFGGFIYVFVGGAQNIGLPTVATIVIFVVISGIFAWLLKRVSDAASDLSKSWFPEDTDKQD
jgi:membrane protein implicated in regulation of membrane protease activity